MMLILNISIKSIYWSTSPVYLNKMQTFSWNMPVDAINGHNADDYINMFYPTIVWNPIILNKVILVKTVASC